MNVNIKVDLLFLPELIEVDKGIEDGSYESCMYC